MAALEFVPYDQLQGILKLEKSDIDEYPDLAAIVNRVKAAFENYLGYKIDLDDYTDTFFQQSSTKFIWLQSLPINSITELLVDDVAWTDYKITNYGLRLPTTISNAAVSVTYNAGYDSDTYPDQIMEAAVIQTCYEYGNVDNIGTTVTTNEGGSVSRPELGLLKEVRRMLDKFISPATVCIA